MMWPFSLSQTALIGMAAVITYQSYSYIGEVKKHKAFVAEVTDRETKRTIAAKLAKKELVIDEKTHEKAIIGAVDSFRKSTLAASAVARNDADRNKRLLADSERRFAYYRAQASADSLACRGLADRLEAFDKHIGQGTDVVAELRSTLAKRDNEVVLQNSTITADRQLFIGNN